MSNLAQQIQPRSTFVWFIPSPSLTPTEHTILVDVVRRLETSQGTLGEN